jgi:hypothetical protein
LKETKGDKLFSLGRDKIMRDLNIFYLAQTQRKMKMAVAYLLKNGNLKTGALSDIMQMYVDSSILLVDPCEENLGKEQKKTVRNVD